jgi:copper homeostasis protein (lipoprotein)
MPFAVNTAVRPTRTTMSPQLSSLCRPAGRPRAVAASSGLALGLLLLGAAVPAQAGEVGPAETALGALPASWVGEIPGASGPIRWHVDLAPDGTYQLRQTYLNRAPDQNFDDIGRWQLEPGSGRLVLRGGREAPVFLQPILGGSALRKLNLEGKPITSLLNDRLTRLGQPTPIDPRLHLLGQFRYLADAPSLQLCATGHTLPVAMEADYLALERAYLLNRAAGEPRLVNVEGLITNRPSMEESQGMVRSVVPERFVSLQSEAQPCPGTTEMPLRGTDWQLHRLEDGQKPALPAAGAQPVQLRLDPDSDRVSGSGGCNRLMGGFELEGPKLRFLPLASTRMACPDPQMAFERRFFNAVELVRGWRIEGGNLLLLDADGRVLLRLVAVAPPAAGG